MRRLLVVLAVSLVFNNAAFSQNLPIAKVNLTCNSFRAVCIGNCGNTAPDGIPVSNTDSDVVKTIKIDPNLTYNTAQLLEAQQDALTQAYKDNSFASDRVTCSNDNCPKRNQDCKPIFRIDSKTTFEKPDANGESKVKYAKGANGGGNGAPILGEAGCTRCAVTTQSRAEMCTSLSSNLVKDLLSAKIETATDTLDLIVDSGCGNAESELD